MRLKNLEMSALNANGVSSLTLMTSMILNELNLNNLEITPYCNFITPPDQATEALASVLLIDADWNEIEEIALWYKNGDRDTCYNIFLYQDIMWESDWLQNIADSVDIIIVNTAESAILNAKMKYIFLQRLSRHLVIK